MYIVCKRRKDGKSSKNHERRVALEVCYVRSQITGVPSTPEAKGHDLWARCEGCTDWIEPMVDRDPECVIPCGACGGVIIMLEEEGGKVIHRCQ
jgi:hypothetical protein